MRDYLDLVLDFMERTTGSIHGIHQTFASPGLPELFRQIPVLLSQLSLAGLKSWWITGCVSITIIPNARWSFSAAIG